MAVISLIGVVMIPLFIVLVLIIATWKRVPTYEAFVEGGKEGVQMAVTLLPFLIGMIVSISILRSSGAIDAAIGLIAPLLSLIGVPAEVTPLAIIRPISGSASLAMTSELIANYGPDSLIGRMASTMQGATDTTLYILTIYFGAVGIKKTKYALKVGLIADLIGIIVTIMIVNYIFGS